jgi:uncharacterized tellurite resistance protein B-like protein
LLNIGCEIFNGRLAAKQPISKIRALLFNLENGCGVDVGTAIRIPSTSRLIGVACCYLALNLARNERREVPMMAGIKHFFNQFIEAGSRQSEIEETKALQIATAALLLEMMRMDCDITVAERDSVAATLLKMFGLDPAQLKTLIDLAEQEARQASGYHQFTSLINKAFDADQKVRIIEKLWCVAMSDGHLHTHETHLMRKIANLLYVGHADYVAAKQRARQMAKLPPV